MTSIKIDSKMRNLSHYLGTTISQLSKRWGAQHSIIILCQETDIKEVDEMLWSYSPISFLSHCRVGCEMEAFARVLLTTSEDIKRSNAILVNLTDKTPQHWCDFYLIWEAVKRRHLTAGDCKKKDNQFSLWSVPKRKPKSNCN